MQGGQRTKVPVQTWDPCQTTATVKGRLKKNIHEKTTYYPKEVRRKHVCIDL